MRDWKFDAMQYRDLDRAIQREVELEMRLERVRALAEERPGGRLMLANYSKEQWERLADMSVDEALVEMEALAAEAAEAAADSANDR